MRSVENIGSVAEIFLSKKIDEVVKQIKHQGNSYIEIDGVKKYKNVKYVGITIDGKIFPIQETGGFSMNSLYFDHLDGNVYLSSSPFWMFSPSNDDLRINDKIKSYNEELLSNFKGTHALRNLIAGYYEF